MDARVYVVTYDGCIYFPTDKDECLELLAAIYDLTPDATPFAQTIEEKACAVLLKQEEFNTTYLYACADFCCIEDLLDKWRER